MRDEDFSKQQEIAATLTDDDTSDRAAVARGATLLIFRRTFRVPKTKSAQHPYGEFGCGLV